MEIGSEPSASWEVEGPAPGDESSLVTASEGKPADHAQTLAPPTLAARGEQMTQDWGLEWGRGVEG